MVITEDAVTFFSERFQIIPQYGKVGKLDKI
jgi:hypothetical protein